MIFSFFASVVLQRLEEIVEETHNKKPVSKLIGIRPVKTRVSEYRLVNDPRWCKPHRAARQGLQASAGDPA